MIRTLFIILVAALVLTSCRSAKKIQSAIAKKDTTAVPVILPTTNPHEDSIAFMKKAYSEVTGKRINFTTFSAKMDVDYTDADGKNYNFNAHLRMYKDSVIWVSVTAILGIEGMRAYITRDSVKLLDKQNKVYKARSVSYLQEETALPLDLVSLQDLFLGNPIFLDSNIVSYSASPNSVSLLCNGDFFKNLVTIRSADGMLQSSKLDDMDELRSRTCYLTYEDYENKKGPYFSTKRKINVSEKKKLDIKLEYRQYAFNETLSFPFTVPKNYKPD